MTAQDDLEARNKYELQTVYIPFYVGVVAATLFMWVTPRKMILGFIAMGTAILTKWAGDEGRWRYFWMTLTVILLVGGMLFAMYAGCNFNWDSCDLD